MRHDKAILTSALEEAAQAYREMNPRPTLLGRDPDRSVLKSLSTAIGSCAAYHAVAGQVLFTGGSGVVLDSSLLAARLFSRGVRFEEDISGAVDWLLRLLTTHEATVLFKAAIWGLSLDQEVALSKRSRLMPFASLATTGRRGWPKTNMTCH
jgi:hypothetical protein